MLLGFRDTRAQLAADHTAEDKSQLPGATTVSPTSTSDSLSKDSSAALAVASTASTVSGAVPAPPPGPPPRRCCRKSAASLCSSRHACA